jgi:hypothetical protein
VTAGSVDPSVYSALATVAAITTAIQSFVALLPLQRSTDLANKQDGKQPSEQAYQNAKNDAKKEFRGHLLLNVVTFLVNGVVLAAWWKVGVLVALGRQWEYWAPWAAVVVAFGALSVTAFIGLKKLFKIRGS